MNTKKEIIYGGVMYLFLLLTSCKKYLEYSSDKKLVIITTLNDLQSLMDQDFTINQRDPCLGESASDNIYLDYAMWESLDEFERAVYIWQNSDVVTPYALAGAGNTWSNCYDIIYKANTVLDNIDKVPYKENKREEWENVMGQAYFLRGKFFMHVAWIWALAYDSNTAKEDMGIPLRLNSDFNEISRRSTLEETYRQIIEDLRRAAQLLPLHPLNPYRPGKAAAYGYLSRVYLSMRDYEHAGNYADSALRINSDLLNYNLDIDTTSSYPFTTLNKEVIYESVMNLTYGLYVSKIDSNLYRSYDNNDIRKKAFFYSYEDEGYGFRGSYTQSLYPFTGIATDEMYLNSIESKARIGRINEAVDQLNSFLITRWASGTYIPFYSTDQNETVAYILAERRKQLLFRELRWMDIKRLNKSGAGLTLKRNLNGAEYVMQPNDLRFAMAIPEDVIARAGMPQNPR